MAKIIAKNKDAFFNYEFAENFEAGIVLKGWEVKSIRAGNVTLTNAFCFFKENELFVSNMHISKYMDIPGDETSIRKLLLSRRQLKKIKEFSQIKGHAIVATVLKWSDRGYIKLDIALGKGKTKYDKREAIKKRDMQRMIRLF